VTDFPAEFSAARHPSLVSVVPRPPAVVYVAAVLTWIVATGTAAVIALSALADAVAVFVVRGPSWARWTLIILSVVAALGGLVSAYYVGPLLVTAASVTVLVLLLLPDAGAWFRAPHIPDPT
jgi:hypothetical protein